MEYNVIIFLCIIMCNINVILIIYVNVRLYLNLLVWLIIRFWNVLRFVGVIIVKCFEKWFVNFKSVI